LGATSLGAFNALVGENPADTQKPTGAANLALICYLRSLFSDRAPMT
jgi:hypothetical protein